jgi:hypothetical protein
VLRRPFLERSLSSSSRPSSSWPGAPFVMLDARLIDGVTDATHLAAWPNAGSDASPLAVDVTWPVYHATDGPEGGARVEFTGVNDRGMRVAALAAHAQPGVICAVARHSAFAAGRVYCAGATPGVDGWQAGAFGTRAVRLHAGVVYTSANNAIAAAGVWGWLVARFDGASTSWETSTGAGAGPVDAGGDGWASELVLGMNGGGTGPMLGDLALVGAWDDGTTVDEVRAWLQAEFPSL